MDISTIFGLSVALATPFGNERQIDLDKASAHAHWCLSNGCSSVTLLGTTAEAASISPSERTLLLNSFVDSGITGNQLITGIFATDEETAIRQMHEASNLGAGRLLVAPPYYFKPVSEDGVFLWYESVFASFGSELPACLLYNLPSQTGVTISPTLVSRLRDRFAEKIIGVKDSSGDPNSTNAFLELHKDIAILVGDERQLASAVALGGQGAICGMANILPGNMLRIIKSASIDTRVNILVDEICQHPIIPALKSLMAVEFEDPDWAFVRPPFVTLKDSDQQDLKRLYLDSR